MVKKPNSRKMKALFKKIRKAAKQKNFENAFRE